MVQLQAVKAKLGADDTPGGQIGSSPRILVLRESGDVEVDINLGDKEDSADGSFARTTTHRRISNGSASEEEEREQRPARKTSRGQS